MSFQQGLSGLNASSKNLDVIGNNVANAGTFGAKSARAEFADMYAASINGSGASNIGIGVQLASVAQQFTQGNITTTENPLDLAINGAGFFQIAKVLSDPGAGPNATPQLDGANLYTRNGQFKINRQGYVENNQQQVLLGHAIDANGLPSASLEPIQLPTTGIKPRMTSGVDLEFNVDARAAATGPAGATHSIDFNDPSSYNNATSVSVFNEQGDDMAVTYYFQKTGSNSWKVFGTVDGNTLQGSAAAPEPIATINFPTSGGNPTAAGGGSVLLADGSTVTNGQIPITVPGSSGPQAITVDLSRATQYGTNFGVTNLSQDGYTAGQLVGTSIDASGVVMARFSNGQSASVAQLELATFRNPQGLQALGGNAWTATYASGDPTRSAPGSGNMGVLQSGALEESNVDLTAELVNMITAQRSYQANAQTIKTQDQVMQTLVNMR